MIDFKKFITQNLNPDQQAYYLKKPLNFASFFYTDNQIRRLFEGYKSLPDFENTIFVITGDHGISYLNPENPIQKYHIPLLVYSPKLKRSKVSKSLASHYDIAPTIISYISKNKGVDFPDNFHWLGNVLQDDTIFNCNSFIPMMPLNRILNEMVFDNYFISANKLYRLQDNFRIEDESNDSVLFMMQQILSSFSHLNNFVCAKNKLLHDLSFFNRSNDATHIYYTNIRRLGGSPEILYLNLYENDTFNLKGNFRVLIEAQFLIADTNLENYPELVIEIREPHAEDYFSYASIPFARKDWTEIKPDVINKVWL